MKSFLSKLKSWIFTHKKISTILLVVILVGGFFLFRGQSVGLTTYVLAATEKGTLISSISGSGQVEALSQIDLKARESGEVIYIAVKPGQEVLKNQTLFSLDARDAQKAVRDAETALETAKLELDKALKPLDELTLLQAENSLTQAKNSKQKAEDNIVKAYEDGFNTVSNAFLDLPELMAGLDNVFFDEGDFERNQWNIYWYSNQVNLDNRDKATRYQDDVTAAYNKARVAYTKNFDNYKATSRTSDAQTIESLITETYETTKLVAETVKVGNNYIDFVQDDMEYYDQNIPSLVSTHQSDIDSYTATTNSNLSSLLSIQRTIKDSREALVDANTTIKERELSLAQTKEGPDDFDIRAKKITIQQREDALAAARQALADYYVRAPFAGLISSVTAKVGDTASGTLGIIITKQKIATVSLNEVDIAKIKLGQKATLTFDAIEDLSITGEIAEIDAVGTVSAGVVNYNVRIAFDTDSDKVKPGMSVSASIITDMKQGVLMVPISAVKTNASGSYIERLSATPTMTANAINGVSSEIPPEQIPVEVGISNDESIEIISGLKEGDQIVTRTVTPTSSSSASTQAPSLFGSPSIRSSTGGRGGSTGGFTPR